MKILEKDAKYWGENNACSFLKKILHERLYANELSYSCLFYKEYVVSIL